MFTCSRTILDRRRATQYVTAPPEAAATASKLIGSIPASSPLLRDGVRAGGRMFPRRP